jgi:hypothetical protein
MVNFLGADLGWSDTQGFFPKSPDFPESPDLVRILRVLELQRLFFCVRPISTCKNSELIPPLLTPLGLSLVRFVGDLRRD